MFLCARAQLSFTYSKTGCTAVCARAKLFLLIERKFATVCCPARKKLCMCAFTCAHAQLSFTYSKKSLPLFVVLQAKKLGRMDSRLHRICEGSEPEGANPKLSTGSCMHCTKMEVKICIVSLLIIMTK